MLKTLTVIDFNIIFTLSPTPFRANVKTKPIFAVAITNFGTPKLIFCSSKNKIGEAIGVFAVPKIKIGEAIGVFAVPKIEIGEAIKLFAIPKNEIGEAIGVFAVAKIEFAIPKMFFGIAEGVKGIGYWVIDITIGQSVITNEIIIKHYHNSYKIVNKTSIYYFSYSTG